PGPDTGRPVLGREVDPISLLETHGHIPAIPRRVQGDHRRPDTGRPVLGREVDPISLLETHGNLLPACSLVFLSFLPYRAPPAWSVFDLLPFGASPSKCFTQSSSSRSSRVSPARFPPVVGPRDKINASVISLAGSRQTTPSGRPR